MHLHNDTSRGIDRQSDRRVAPCLETDHVVEPATSTENIVVAVQLPLRVVEIREEPPLDRRFHPSIRVNEGVEGNKFYTLIINEHSSVGVEAQLGSDTVVDPPALSPVKHNTRPTSL